MKKLSVFFSSALLLLTSCGDAVSPFNFSGKIEGVSSDTLLLYYSDVHTGKWFAVDTVPMVNGCFETTVPDSIMLEISLAAKRRYNSKEGQIVGDQVYFFPGDRMQLKGYMPFGVEASGTALYDGLAKYDDYVQFTKRLAAIETEINATDDDAQEDSLYDISDRLTDSLNTVKFNMIKAEPNTDMAGFLSLDLSPEIGVEAMKRLTEEVKQGAFSDLIAEAAEGYQRDIDVAKAAQAIQPDCVAPDFKLPGLDGKEKTLADFRGKYVVLDFWGTWCGWCIAGIPQMKTYYKKYQKQVEFVGICSFDTEEKWRAAVAKHEIPWVNLLDNEVTDVVKTYGISGFPTKIIIDGQGKIVAVFEGESEEFYAKLDAMFK